VGRTLQEEYPMKLENILILSCRSPYLDNSKVYVPMASLYLKSFVDKHAPHAKIYLGDDNYTLEDPRIFEPYQSVGISIMTPQRDEAYRLARFIKQHFPEKIVIAGGPHVKHYQKEVTENKDFDYVIPLDGERPLAHILNGTATNRVMVDIMTREDIATAPRPDRLSDTARALISRYNYTLGNRNSTTMMTSRGCPMQCAFCEDARTTAKWSNLENVKGELDDIASLGFSGAYIFDDLFAIAMEKVRPICNELKKRDIIYRCNGQANFFTKFGKDFAKMLADTGCYEIAFGHESGSQKILDNIFKKTLVEQNYKSVEYAKEVGIKVKSFLMIGLPGEDEETIAATEKFIRETKPENFQLAVYYPYKGTQIRDAIDRGDSTFDLQFEGEGLGAYGQKGGSTEAVVRTKAFSSADLLRIRDELVNKYRPESHSKKWDDKFFDTKIGESCKQ
jgi:radical SAM superfamily enzyme YgiQ (UPF0313 family)